MRTPRQWFSDQVRYFNIQKAYAMRDEIANTSVAEYDNFTQSVAGLPVADRKIAQYEQRTSKAPEIGERLNAHNELLRENAGLDQTDLLTDGKGIGGFLGKLVTGRLSKQTRNASQQNYNRMTNEMGLLTPPERADYNTLREQREQREAQTREALGVMKDYYDRLNELNKEALAGIKEAQPNFSMDTDQYGRLAMTCMKEGSENKAYNMDVCRTLTEYARMQKEDFTKGIEGDPRLLETRQKVIGLLSPHVDRLNGINVGDVNVNDMQSIYRNVDDVTFANFAVHPFNDIASRDPGMAKELFGTVENYLDFNQRGSFLTGAYRGAKAKLFEQLPDDNSYLNYAIVSAERSETKQKAVDQLNKHYEINNKSKPTFEEYRQSLDSEKTASRRAEVQSRFASVTRDANQPVNYGQTAAENNAPAASVPEAPKNAPAANEAKAPDANEAKAQEKDSTQSIKLNDLSKDTGGKPPRGSDIVMGGHRSPSAPSKGKGGK